MTTRAEDIDRAARRVGDAVPQLAREVIAEYAAGAQRFAEAGMPAHLDRESTHTVRTLLRVCVVALTDPDPDRRTQVREVVERSTDRVAEGLPLGEYLRCWHIAFELFSRAVRAELPDEIAWPAIAQARHVFDAMLREVADAYDLAARDLAAISSGRDAEIISALFAGTGWAFDDPGTLPDLPLVVLLHLEQAPGEDSPDPLTRSTARRRKIRLLRAQLAREITDLWLVDVDSTSGRLILRTPPADQERLLADLNRVCSARITAASARADALEDLPRAAEIARSALRSALRHGRRGRWVTMADVAVEHHLAHPSAARSVLVERCREVLERPELLTTVRSFVAHDLDRRATARDLFVHPNTVDNRLARIRSLTGLDVHSTRDLLTLIVAALTHGEEDEDAVIWSQPSATSAVPVDG